MMLSPPNPKRDGLRAVHAANRATPASRIIQAMVRYCSRWTRAMRSVGESDRALAIELAFYSSCCHAALRLHRLAVLSLLFHAVESTSVSWESVVVSLPSVPLDLTRS